jgi:hypothetical protein
MKNKLYLPSVMNNRSFLIGILITSMVILSLFLALHDTIHCPPDIA